MSQNRVQKDHLNVHHFILNRAASAVWIVFQFDERVAVNITGLPWIH